MKTGDIGAGDTGGGHQDTPLVSNNRSRRLVSGVRWTQTRTDEARAANQRPGTGADQPIRSQDSQHNGIIITQKDIL